MNISLIIYNHFRNTCFPQGTVQNHVFHSIFANTFLKDAYVISRMKLSLTNISKKLLQTIAKKTARMVNEQFIRIFLNFFYDTWIIYIPIIRWKTLIIFTGRFNYIYVFYSPKFPVILFVKHLRWLKHSKYFVTKQTKCDIHTAMLIVPSLV